MLWVRVAAFMIATASTLAVGAGLIWAWAEGSAESPRSSLGLGIIATMVYTWCVAGLAAAAWHPLVVRR